MKFLIIYIVLTLFSISISFGYSSSSKLIDDINDWIYISDDEKDWEEIVSMASAISYLRAYDVSRKYTLRKAGIAMTKLFLETNNKNDSDKNVLDTLNALNPLGDTEQLQLRVFGFVIPKNATYNIKAKVILRFAENNPALLTYSPHLFINSAYEDAWGSN